MLEMKVIAAAPGMDRGCDGGSAASSCLSSTGQVQLKQTAGKVLRSPACAGCLRQGVGWPGSLSWFWARQAAARGREDAAAFL